MSRPGRSHSVWAIAVVVLGMGFSLLPLLRGQFFFAMDNATLHYPETALLHDALRHHALPEWWFDVGFGAPVLAEGQSANYYPPRVLLAALFDTPTAFMLEIGLYLALSGLGTYCFLRQFRLHPLACFAGALAFMFGSQCVIYVRSMALLRASCLFPWVMYIAERYALRRRPIDLLWAALASGLQFLAGNPTYAAITAVVAPLYLLLRNLQIPAMRRPAKLALSLTGWLLAIGLGAAIAAAQLIPTFLHLRESVRAGGLSIEYTANSLRAHYKDLLQLLFPYAFDLGDLTANGLFNPAAISGFYAGSAIALAALCLAAWIRRVTDRALPLVICGVLTIVIALGSSTPVFALLARLPLLGSFRFPARYLLCANFCTACLGAIALHRVAALSRMRTRNTFPRPLGILFLGILPAAGAFWLMRPSHHADILLCLTLLAVSAGLVTALFRARGTLQRNAILAAICLFLFADLLHFRSRWNYASTADIAQTLRKDGAAGWLAHDPDQFRILALGQEDSGRFNLKDTLVQSSPPVWGLQSAAFEFSLGLKNYGDFLARLMNRIRTDPEHARDLFSLLDFMRVKYVVAPPKLNLPDWEPSLKTPASTVWRNPAFHNAALLIGRIQPEKEAGEIGGIDFRKTAIVAGNPPSFPSSDDPGEAAPLPPQVDELDFRVNARSPALLVVPNNFYPGWSATVNGKPAPIYRTDWIGMGVPVATGTSLVRLHFVTPGSRLGRWVSAAAILLWLAAFFVARRYRGLFPGHTAQLLDRRVADVVEVEPHMRRTIP